MKTNRFSTRHATGAAIAALLATVFSPNALAQQRPITGQMMDGRTTAATPPPAPLQPPPPQPAATMARPAATTPPTAPVSIPPPSSYTTTPTYYATQVGATTRHLLQMQARGDLAGPPRPMLGAEASASYQRYLKSFEHPIPEFYEATVGKNARNGR